MIKFFLLFVAVVASVVAAAPVCPSLPVELQLRPQSNSANAYQLVFLSHDANAFPDYVDIHYRVNNQDGVNIRALSRGMLGVSQPIHQTQLNGIVMYPGDTLRSYATYQWSGFNCDTDVHTFTLPYPEEQQHEENHGETSSTPAATPSTFHTQAVEEHAACPAIQFQQKIQKMSGLENSYVLTFDNLQPEKQLEYLDLHLQFSDGSADNLRLGSDLELTHARSVMQPAIVIRPNEQLTYYYTYKLYPNDVECTTEHTTVKAEDVKDEIDISSLQREQQQMTAQRQH